MSFLRLIYYSAILGGWAAFVGWLVFECLLLKRAPDWLAAPLCAALVGGGIAVGLALVGGLSSSAWRQTLLRLGPGLGGGIVAGLVGGALGEILYSLLHNRAVGWTVMGLAIGAVEGLYEKSPRKLRNGLIGGGIGGFLGGVLFETIAKVLASDTGMTSRAAGFAVLGMFIGLGIGLVQVVLKEAWLTVLDGYRPGRQLILSQAVTTLGSGEWANLPFMGNLGKDLELEHLRLSRQSDGSFLLEDNNSRIGTTVNNHKVLGSHRLRDGDVIKIGANIVRFNQSSGKGGGGLPPPPTPVETPVAAIPVSPLPPARPAPAPVPAPAARPAPVSAVPVSAPPKPAPVPAQTVPAKPVQPAAASPAPPPTGKAPAGDVCPKCGRKVPGAPGQRYCIIDDITF